MAFAEPKQQVINFLKKAPSASDKCYIIELSLISHDDAEAFIHRMRVELSRLRDYIKIKGQQIRPFKMLKENIENKNGKTFIKLRYKNSVDEKTLDEINEVFDTLSTGSPMINEKKARNLPENKIFKL